jgi:MFS family permease
MLPFAVPLFVAPRIAARLLHRWSQRNCLLLGLGITVAGDLLLGACAHLGSYAVIALAMIVAGTGTGVLNPESAKAIQAEIPPERAGMASGIGATVRFISLLLGVAVLGAVMARYAPAFTGTRDASAAPGFAAVALVAAVIGMLAFAGTATLMGRRADRGDERSTTTMPALERS